MASTQDASIRVRRLGNVFWDMVKGVRPVTAQNAHLFLEAIITQPSPSACVETIVGSTAGLDAVGAAVRSKLTAPFIAASTLPLLRYLSDPRLKALVDGQLLEQLLLTIVKPPTVWNTLMKLYKNHEISDENLFPFAWLALELVSLPSRANVDVLDDAKYLLDGGRLLKCSNHAAREAAYRMQKVLHIGSSSGENTEGAGPGGRHDNDFADFRKISIYPTTDEFLSKEQPFYLTAVEVRETDVKKRASVHMDNQFRLLREDMLAELREDLQVAMGIKKGNRKPEILGALVPVGIETGETVRGRYTKFKPCTLMVRCHDGCLRFLSEKWTEPNRRKKYLKDHANFLKHEAFGVLCRDKEIFGFAFLDRNVDKLAQTPPVLCLQFTDSHGLRNALLALTLPKKEQVRFILVGTSVFAYEPVLRALQRATVLPLLELLVNPRSTDFKYEIPTSLQLSVLELRYALKPDGGRDSVTIASPTTGKRLTLDASQANALVEALESPLSITQGPPGTGKSFTGAQMACYLFKANLRILVIGYTNHATDQFALDMYEAGIPKAVMVRIGSKAKCKDAVLPMLLSEQQRNYRRSPNAWDILRKLENKASDAAEALEMTCRELLRSSFQWQELTEYLEFSEQDAYFLDGLRVPADANGWKRSGKQGKQVRDDYLYDQWKKGNGPGAVGNEIPKDAKIIWSMPRDVRLAHVARWERTLAEDRLEHLEELARQFGHIQRDIDLQLGESKVDIVKAKKVMACTTSGAAKHSHLIRAFEPDVLLVEEAGEILESHILTAMTPSVKQIILIGDHKQLRPKYNNYDLSVEKGDGFDFNRSLFERLIQEGREHSTLEKQHRMVPEISVFPRQLTYPRLVDGPKTSNREPIRGVQDRVVFLNHSKMENTDNDIKERRDPTEKKSPKNDFEAEMVMQCVKYFGQQGYSSDQIVVLTPYLGQLRAIRDLFQKNQHDAELSEMDKADLIRAGLITQVEAKVASKPVRISTIDNYQGEESDIVIASLTRSNEKGIIGFMSAPERLNVLVTRARNCIVLIGNMETFMKSEKGSSTWVPFFEILKANGHLYDGLPVKCEKHPDKKALLAEPIHFETFCPDGGCAEPCNALLKCRVHRCRSRCHRIVDHSNAECNQLVGKICQRQHQYKVKCGKQEEGCRDCIREDKEMERRAKRNLQLEEDRRSREAAYTKQLQEIQDELEHQRRINKYKAEARNREQIIQDHKQELADLKKAEQKLEEQNQQRAKLNAVFAQKKQARADQKKPDSSEAKHVGDVSFAGSQAEWESLKASEGAICKPLDELMGMIGLEEVKDKFLSIKSKVDTALRQGVSLATERFSCSMLGNPGTGKTTVARMYADFLTELCVIPGSCFKEDTGAGLANIGVSGCKKLIEEILNGGGGVLFIDEAYQLTSGNNPGGGAVLDYLLAEVENLRGKVVFVLAGYNKQMESFFAHNPGLTSRFPVEMKFADYTDDELLRILELKINKKYNNLMECQDGIRGLYCRIVSRRTGRGRGKDGFGNARSIENALDVISRRQADRLRRERRKEGKPNDLFFSKEDLIGPEPDEALTKSEAWKKLQGMIGLRAVKEGVRSLVDSIQQNYYRELEEKPPIEYSLNKVFLGNPGTGKTTVAKLYGQILVELGLLSKGEVVVKNPSDFVGGALGQSEQQTKGILAAAIGKVLVIDEAYGLYSGGDAGSVSDPYKTAVIDTIVAEVQSVPGDDRCVLLLGYKDQMEKMFQNVNPGLSRRFPIASGFNFEDFSDEELLQIFHLKLKQQAYEVTPQGAEVAMEMVKRARNRPNFGNGGEIDILLDSAKARHQTRFSKGQAKSDHILAALDFDENFDRADKSETNVRKLFEGTIGCEETIKVLEDYQETVKTMKRLDLDPKENIPFNFLFRGPPGTGKTTTAKKMGKVFYDMGFLATDEVVECSATDLIGQFVGQTGPKVQKLLDKALGKVLFVDEAYRLAEGHFAKEAMDELVDSVTKDRYFKKLIIILAGYTKDINRLMSVNSGLTSRFPAVINFRSLTPEECLELLIKLLQKEKLGLNSKGKKMILDLSCLEQGSARFEKQLVDTFTALTTQDNWASARDVQSLCKLMFNKVLKDRDGLAKGRIVLTEDIVKVELEAMLKERASRATSAAKTIFDLMDEHAREAPQEPEALAHQHKTTTTTNTQAKVDNKEEEEKPVKRLAKLQRLSRVEGLGIRDAGVSDDVWEQLQRDRQAEIAREEEYQRLLKAKETATEEAREKIVTRLLEEDARRRKEQALKEKLNAMGKCPAGFNWIAQDSGYRCGGGSHFISKSEVEKMLQN
ncbi:putative AAA family ATPase [Podospora fimiseda]|uniref:AAA family ATPase n=1 Tax=Podospora fimiseda TaxID=252190 RepID=A0AAN7BRC7_9PEZI|nr:putative AAA family ATPase [Podospora fimiseda]